MIFFDGEEMDRASDEIAATLYRLQNCYGVFDFAGVNYCLAYLLIARGYDVELTMTAASAGGEAMAAASRLVVTHIPSRKWFDAVLHYSRKHREDEEKQWITDPQHAYDTSSLPARCIIAGSLPLDWIDDAPSLPTLRGRAVILAARDSIIRRFASRGIIGADFAMTVMLQTFLARTADIAIPIVEGSAVDDPTTERQTHCWLAGLDIGTEMQRLVDPSFRSKEVAYYEKRGEEAKKMLSEKMEWSESDLQRRLLLFMPYRRLFSTTTSSSSFLAQYAADRRVWWSEAPQSIRDILVDLLRCAGTSAPKK